ncbi:MAG: hypothetical protein ACE5FY_02775 [Nitrospiria bacterium]
MDLDKLEKRIEKLKIRRQKDASDDQSNLRETRKRLKRAQRKRRLLVTKAEKIAISNNKKAEKAGEK